MTREEIELRLQEIKKAIDAIEGGAQEYELGDLRVRKANLKDLYAEYFRLQQELEKIKYNTRAYVRFT